MEKETQDVLVLLSILALLNVMFVPVFDVWGGLFPSNPDATFFDAFELAFGENEWDRWVVQLTFSIFFPSVFMLITALYGKKGLFLISNCTGLLLISKQMCDYMKQHSDGLKYAFDMEDGHIAIGTWVAIGLFFVAFIVVTSNPSASKKRLNPLLFSTPNTAQMGQKEEVVPSTMTCPSCGYEQPAGRKVCWKCAKPFIDIVEQPVEITKEEVVSENIYCINCGREINNADVFCAYCGEKVLKSDEGINNQEVEHTGILCPSCGGKVETGDTFCVNCGSRINN